MMVKLVAEELHRAGFTQEKTYDSMKFYVKKNEFQPELISCLPNPALVLFIMSLTPVRGSLHVKDVNMQVREQKSNISGF